MEDTRRTMLTTLRMLVQAGEEAENTGTNVV